MNSAPIATIVLLCLPPAVLAPADEADRTPSPRLHAIDPQTPEGLRELFKPTGESLHLVGAHRGGPRKGFPENCIATFEDTLRHTYAMMEVDPRYTKDRAIVLHHDATLERTTNGKGRVADQTLRELKQLRLRDPEGNLTKYTIPTLDEALAWARGKTILVLDQKDVPIEARVRKIEEHRAEAYAVLIVYRLDDAKACHAMNKNIMMEVMMSSPRQLEAFKKTGLPGSQVIAFVGHSPSRDAGLYKTIHAGGASCMAGTSRNLDLQLVRQRPTPGDALAKEYRALLASGIDLIETDRPREVGRLLYADRPVPASRAKFFQVRQP